MNRKNIIAKQSWKNIDNHFISAITNEWYHKLVEVQNLISIHTTKFYQEKEIKTLYLPVTTGSISSPMGLGSDSSPVKVNVCGIDTYLADSMQFMLEYGCRFQKQGCYYIMPSFRGENADDRHLCQFYHSEAEIPGKLEDVICLVENYLSYLSTHILEDFGESLEKIAGTVTHVEAMAKKTEALPRITINDAIKKLNNDTAYVVNHKSGFQTLNSNGEKELIRLFNGPVWLTHFNVKSVPFYQATDPENKELALNADLLMGIGETVGSGERHFNGKELLESLRVHELDIHEYEWYYRLKEEFPLKTSGFGMGIERFILWLFKHNDIRDCQLLPRFNGVNIVP